MSEIKFLKTREVTSPYRANRYDAGIDFFVPFFTEEFKNALINKNNGLIIHDNYIVVQPQKRVLIPAGIKCKMLDNTRALIAFNKSGVASKQGLVVGAQVVDYEYQGEIHINVINTSDVDVVISEGSKLVQFLELPIYTSEIFMVDTEEALFNGEITTRGEGGFGSTDKK